MSKLTLVGKGVLLKEEEENVLALGDLHLGYEENLRRGGVFVPNIVYEQIIKELDYVFSKNKIDRIVLLGDLKHEFGRISRDEWNEVLAVLDYVTERVSEVLIVKGNHDTIIDPIARKRNVKVVDFFIWKDTAFIHGDKDFEAIHDKRVKRWVIGHAHPAVTFKEGKKRETYKCFLVGEYKKKEVVIVPSVFSLNMGTDPRDFPFDLVWNFKIERFNVFVINEEDNEILDFGMLKKIKH